MDSIQRGAGFATAVAAAAVAAALLPSAAGAVTSATLSDPQPPDPVAGETVTFTLSSGGLVQNAGSAFELRDQANLDGSPLDAKVLGAADSPPVALSTAYALPGPQAVVGLVNDAGVPVGQPGSQAFSTVKSFTVYAPLSGSIAPVPGTPKLGTPITLTASGAGGKPGLTYAWDLDGDGFDDGTGPSITPTISGGVAGPRTIRVQMSDGAVPAHRLTASTVVTFAPADANPPPPPPADCRNRFAWAIYEITTTGCFAKDPKDGTAYTTTSPVQVNGLRLTPTAGAPFRIVPGSTTTAGSISLKGATIGALGTTFFRGTLSLALPGGKQAGQEAEVGSLDVASGAQLHGFGIVGTLPLTLGLNTAGRYYANVTLAVALPKVFKAGPAKDAPGLTSKVVVSFDRSGVSTTGVKLEAQDAYIGLLKIQSLCFAYADAGERAVDPCAPPKLGGEPYLTCAQDVTAARWSGSAVVQLPTASKTRLAAFGSVSGGELASLGGFVDKLGTSVPLATGVYLNRVGVGICVKPPPFKLRGDVGVSILPNASGTPTVAVNGYFIYTDPNGSDPWSLELGGTVLVLNKQVGSGKVIIKGSGALDFEVQVGIEFGIVKVEGGVSGWIEPALRRFLVQGFVRGCLGSVCARTDGLVSNQGLAGCADLGEIRWFTLERDADWAWYAWWRLHVVWHSTPLRAGFGYTWQPAALSLLGSSCDFGPWTPSRAAGAAFLAAARPPGLATAAQGLGTSFDVPAGTPALALRVRGVGAAPKVRISGPGGVTVQSAADSPAARAPGSWMVAENSLDASTSVVILNPRAGAWRVESLPGSAAIAGVDVSNYAGEPAVVGGVGDLGRGRRVVNVAFDIPAGTVLRLEEAGPDTQQTLSAHVKGSRCHKAVAQIPQVATRVVCASVRFTPARGSGGRRRILAVVTRRGLPVLRKVIATYRAPAWAKPARPRRIGAARRGRSITVSWTRAAGASRYSVTLVGSDGTSSGFDVAGRCRAVRFGRVDPAAQLTAVVRGVRSDQVAGPEGLVRLRAGGRTSGSRVPRATPRCT